MPRSSLVLLVLLAACGSHASTHAVSSEPAAATPTTPAPTEPAPPSHDDEPHVSSGPQNSGWRVIQFVDVPDAFGAGTVLHADLFASGAGGTRLSLLVEGVSTDVLHDAQIRMHVASATPVNGTLQMSSPVILGGPRGDDDAPPRISRKSVTFAWQGAPLDEAFIEVDAGAAGRFWLEVPYGFVSGASLPAGATDARETAQRPPAMASLGARDHWVPFRDVLYDLGVIQNGWRLTARLFNPFDAHATLELYRDDSQVGRSMFLWGLSDPPTHVEILEADGSTLHAMQMQARLHDDGMRRSDDFHFDRSGGRTTRATGTFRATVGERTVEWTIPSSLYGYTHGTADAYDTHRVANAEQVLGPGLF